MATVNLLGALALEETLKDVSNTMAYIRRMCRLLESSGNNDVGGRQRVTVDAMTAGMTLTAVGTVSSVTGVTTVTNLATIAGYDHRQWQDGSRVAYNTGVRSNLIFS